MSACFPELVGAILAVEHDFVCDGELVVLHEHGRPQWDRLKRRHVLRHPGRIKQAAAAEPACVFAFDLLWLNGEDYRPWTPSARWSVVQPKKNPSEEGFGEANP